MKKNKKYWLNYGLFVGPILCSFFLFYLLPIILGIGYSLYDWNGISNAKKFVGLDNYIKLFTGDKNYFASLIFTFKYAFFSVILTNLLAMAFALWVTGRLKSSVWMRTCFFLPNVICAVVAGMLWKFILNQAVPQLGKITGISILGTKLLASPQTAWIAVLIVSLWQGAGYNMIIYIAGLLSIDKGYYESAMEKLKEAYAEMNSNVEIEIQTSDSTTGMQNAIDGVCDIGMASRELKDSELDAGLTPTVIALDGIAVIVNNSNPTDEMTSDQVKSIFTGDALAWDEAL